MGEVALDVPLAVSHGRELGEAGRKLLQFTERVRTAMAPYDPDAGDSTGQAIAAKYGQAQTLLDTSANAGKLLVDMADLYVKVVHLGMRGEQLLEEDLDDLNYDVKLPPATSGDQDAESPFAPGAGGRH